MTTSGQKLLAAIHEVAAHERGEIQLNTVSVPIKSVTDWREAAEWAQSRIADLEASIERKDALLRRALGALDLYKAYGWPDRNGVIPAIKQELSQ